MEMERAGYLVAEIRCEMREDCAHLFSSELPGFHLAVRKTDQFDESEMLAAIQWYFKAMKGLNVRVERAVSPLQFFGGGQAATADRDVRRVVMTPEFAVA